MTRADPIRCQLYVVEDATTAALEFRKDRNSLVGAHGDTLTGWMARSGGPSHIVWLMDGARWERSHGSVREHAAGRSRGIAGVTIWDLSTFLPGTCSVTLLGPELASGLDVAAARQGSEVTVRDLEGGQLMLQVHHSGCLSGDDPLVHGTELATRVDEERRSAGALGDDFFFDRDRTDRELRQAPAFVEALDARRASPIGRR